MESSMFLLRNLLLVAMAVSLVMAQEHDDGVELKQCVGDEFEESYFNFDIEIDDFSEDCEDFEGVGMAIQLLIDKVQMVIPEYEEEFIDATVCPVPTFLAGDNNLRHLARTRAMSGTYSFAGAGGCRRCAAKRSTRQLGRYLVVAKQHENESLRHFDIRKEQEVWLGRGISSRELEHANQTCETLVTSTVVDAAVAERAVARAEEKLNDFLATAAEKETKELLDGQEIERFVNEAQKTYEKFQKAGIVAKARAMLVEKACEITQNFNATMMTPEDQEGFVMAANDLNIQIQKDAKEAQTGFNKIGDQTIGLKIEIVESRFREKESAFNEEIVKLEAQVRKELKELEAEMKKIDAKVKNAKKTKNKNLEEELQLEIEILNDKSKVVEDEFEAFKENETKRIKNDFEFAIGSIYVESANSFEDYMDAFAFLMKKALPGHLKTHVKFSSCFDKEPHVKVKVDKLNGKDEENALLKGCPKADK